MKKLLIGCVLLLVGLGAWSVTPLVARWAHRGHTDEPSGEPPAIEFQGVDLVEYAAGTKLWDLKADQVHYDPDRQVAHLNGIRARFWEHGRVVSTAVSPTAVFETQTRDLRMGGGIEVSAANANTLVKANEVVWQAASQSLHASGSVTFQRGPSRLMGPELWGNRSLEKVRMGSPIQARIRLDQGL